MNLTKYKLGDLIVQRREKNNNYDVPIRGVSKEGFIPAKQKDADTSIYNVFYKYDFVFNPARMELNSIALNLEYDKALCSSLYEVFYVKDESIVLPEFLNLHIKRDEFARHCDYIGLGSAREYCRFANIAEFDIELPPIEVQEGIVEADRLIKKRIRLNNQMIQHLEATAQALYRKTFVDNIDKENLPEGWRMGTLGEFGVVITGKTPSSDNPEDFGNDMPFVTPGDFGKYHKFAIGAERELSEIGVKRLNGKVLTKGSVIVTCIGSDMGKVTIASEECITNQQMNSIIVNRREYSDYLFYVLSFMSKELRAMALGSSTMPLLNKSDFERIGVIFPPNDLLVKFSQLLNTCNETTILKQKENIKLTELQSLLLAKMGQ